MKNYVKPMAIFGFGLLLQLWTGCSESMGTRQSGSAPLDTKFQDD
jgi:hypothetical protein